MTKEDIKHHIEEMEKLTRIIHRYSKHGYSVEQYNYYIEEYKSHRNKLINSGT